MKDTAAREQLQEARDKMVQEYEHLTRVWIRDPEAKEAKAQRDVLATQLGENYWKLDPYLRARTLYDRQGLIQPGGKVDWYVTAPPSNGAKTSANDVD